MKNFINKLNPEWILRITLGAMYLYSGYDIILHPKAWHWAIESLPMFMQNTINSFGIDLYLQIQGGVELAVAVIFFLWFLPKILSKIAVVFAVLEMASILLLVGIDGVTFRDIGLLGAALALAVILFKENSTSQTQMQP